MPSRELPKENSTSPEEWIETYQHLVSTAKQSLDSGDVEKGMLYLQQAIALAAENEALVEQGKSLNSLALAQEQDGQPFAAHDTLAQAIEVLRRTEAVEPLANALNNLGFVERNLGNLEMARQQHQTALDLLDGVSEFREVGRSLSNLGLIYKDKGQLTEAIAYFERSLEHFEIEEEALREKAHVLLGMGLILELLNDVEGTREYYQQALAAYRQIGDQENEALTLHNLGQLEDNQENFLEALNYYYQALSINLRANRANYTLGLAEDLSSLAALIEVAWKVEGDVSADSSIGVERLLVEGLKSLRQELMNSGNQRAMILTWVDRLSQDNGQVLAQQLREQALSLHEEIGNRRGQIWLLTDMAIVARDREEYSAAEGFLERALKLAENLDSPRELHETYLNLGEVYMMAGEQKQAITAFEAAVELAESLRVSLLREEEALGYFNAFNLVAYERLVRLNAQDDPGRALEVLEQMKGREFLRRLRWGEVVRSHLASSDLLMRETEAFAQLQQASKALEQLSGRDSITVVNAYHLAEQRVVELWTEVAAIDPEYVALRQGRPVIWEGLKKYLSV